MRVAGRTLARPRRRHRRAGAPAAASAYVFQDYALFPHLTVVQNVAFGLQRGWRNPAREIAARGGRALDARLRARCRWRATTRSSSPAASASAPRWRARWCAQPRALLLDEPFAALDPALRARLRDELADLQAQLGIPMVLITHDEPTCTASATRCSRSTRLAAGTLRDAPGRRTRLRRQCAARTRARLRVPSAHCAGRRSLTVERPRAGRSVDRAAGRVWMTVGGDNLGGQRRVGLLRAIAEHGSITQAAKAIGMSYKAAWDAIDTMNNLAGAPLVERSSRRPRRRLDPAYRTRGAAARRPLRRRSRPAPPLRASCSATRRSTSPSTSTLMRMLNMKTSARNQFLGTVSGYKAGAVNDEIELDAGRRRAHRRDRHAREHRGARPEAWGARRSRSSRPRRSSGDRPRGRAAVGAQPARGHGVAR